MTATVMLTALPITLAADATAHLTAFVTHKLEPDPSDPDNPTLADFPAVADWVDTLDGCTLTLTSSVDPNKAIPLIVVTDPAPTANAWTACLPPTVPVAGFPKPTYSQADWRTLPASRLSDHAVDLHLAAASAAPTRPPAVQGNTVAMTALQTTLEVSPSHALRALLDERDQRAGRDAAVLARRSGDATTTIGPLSETVAQEGPPPLPPYQSEIISAPSPIEILLGDTDADAQLTQRLDEMIAHPDPAGAPPALQMMLDAHATRRYYERPDEPQQDPQQLPDPDPPVKPRPPKPEHDFHQRVGGFGSTPVLLRALGLAIDLRIDDPDPAALLDGATWVTITLHPPQDSDLTTLPSRRTAVITTGDVFQAQPSSTDWVGGALPLAADSWRILDLDPDASGLKLDQHLRSLTRRLAIEANGDPTTSAPATLRTNGFAIARVGRADATQARVATAEQQQNAGPDDPLHYDDLVRGIRVQVWDDVTKEWHSLHRRCVTVTGTADYLVLDDAKDEGFLQLSALNRNPDLPDGPLYVHEVIAGWEGWSLSAPRPGKVIVHVEPPNADGSTEAVADSGPDATGDTPGDGIQTRSRVEPGSLPRLRYGTSYSFRILGVDLAGNSVPQQVFSVQPTKQDVAAARAHLEVLRQVYAGRDAVSLTEALRRPAPASTDNRPSTAGGDVTELPEQMRTGNSGIDRALGAALGLARVRTGAEAPTPDPFDDVARATRILADSELPLRVRPQLGTAPETLAQLAARAGAAGPGGVSDTLQTVTAPRPYLRWDPVPFPALVPKKALGTGEQPSRLVVRSGLADDDPDAASTSQRHIAPPKSTQLDAEAAGQFDKAIGTTDPPEVIKQYRIALVEEGTFLDREAPNPADPFGPIEQTGIALVSRPGADPGTATTLGHIATHRGAPLGEGQYVIHDTHTLQLPYLPDSYADGITLVFYEAGAPHRLPEPKVLQSVTIPYPGTWPQLQPLRLVLDRGTDPDVGLSARVHGHVVHVTVPRGESVGAWLSSSVRRDDLDRFGMWRSQLASVLTPGADGGLTADQLAAAEALIRAASSGWTWWLTPSTDLTLVHAVPRPVTPPYLLSLRILERPPGRGVVALVGVVDVHGPSTERLYLRASWTETVDDVTTDGPQQQNHTAVVTNSPVGPQERSGVVGLVDFQQSTAGVDLAEGTIGLHQGIQKFPDTHHRVVTYVPSGTTRYRELFAPSDVPADDDPTLAGEPITLDIPSSSRPVGADILDTVPLLRWERTVEPAEPFALRSVRRSGVRIWLSRPWFSSGDGELLGVLTFDPFEPVPNHPDQVRLKGVQARDNSTSLWGKDPLALFGGDVGDLTAATNPPLVPLREQQLAAASQGQLPIEPAPARPVAVVDDVALVDDADEPVVRVYGYRPDYDTVSQRWFADIALEDTPALWPFVRLAVARYQPSSLPGMALSPVAVTSWVQPLPTRTLTVSRQSHRRIQVTLTGTVSLMRFINQASTDLTITADTPTGIGEQAAQLIRASRRVYVSLQHLPDGAGDLGWQTIERDEIYAPSVDGTWKATWTGALIAPDGHWPDLPPIQTPGSSTAWRVLVEETEILDSDNRDETAIDVESVPIERLVYADTVAL
jgi:hypothetical protein